MNWPRHRQQWGSWGSTKSGDASNHLTWWQCLQQLLALNPLPQLRQLWSACKYSTPLQVAAPELHLSYSIYRHRSFVMYHPNLRETHTPAPICTPGSKSISKSHHFSVRCERYPLSTNPSPSLSALLQSYVQHSTVNFTQYFPNFGAAMERTRMEGRNE